MDAGASTLKLFGNRVRARRALTVTAAVRILASLLYTSSATPKLAAHQDDIDMFGLPGSSSPVYLIARA